MGHTGAVTGVAVATHGDACVSCGNDATVKLWRLEAPQLGDAAAARDGIAEQQADATYEGKFAFRGVSHHFKKDLFVTAGPCVEVWDHQRSEPINQFQWGTESVQSVRFNPVRTYTARALALPLLHSPRAARPRGALDEPVPISHCQAV